MFLTGSSTRSGNHALPRPVKRAERILRPVCHYDGTIPMLPDRLLIDQLLRQPLTVENLRMDANDQYLLGVGSVEDAYPTALEKRAGLRHRKS